jgi:hypothetical protein
MEGDEEDVFFIYWESNFHKLFFVKHSFAFTSFFWKIFYQDLESLERKFQNNGL